MSPRMSKITLIVYLHLMVLVTSLMLANPYPFVSPKLVPLFENSPRKVGIINVQVPTLADPTREFKMVIAAKLNQFSDPSSWIRISPAVPDAALPAPNTSNLWLINQLPGEQQSHEIRFNIRWSLLFDRNLVQPNWGTPIEFNAESGFDPTPFKLTTTVGLPYGIEIFDWASRALVFIFALFLSEISGIKPLEQIQKII